MELHTFIVPDGIKPCKLEALCIRMLPQLPPYAIAQAFRLRDVKQNGVRAKKNAISLPGAVVHVYITPQKARETISVLYQDDALLVVRKPAGLSCEADAKGGATVPELCQMLLSLPKPPLLCHRLDNPTQGLLLLAKTEGAESAMREAFAKRLIAKKYVCLVKGDLTPKEAVLTAYLRKDAKRARVTVRQDPFAGAVEIKTGYRVLEKGDATRLSVDLITGRTHQIRAHLAFLGHPVLGDDAYGDRDWNKHMGAKGLKLCACDMTFALTGEYAYLNDKHFTTDPSF